MNDLVFAYVLDGTTLLLPWAVFLVGERNSDDNISRPFASVYLLEAASTCMPPNDYCELVRNRVCQAGSYMRLRQSPLAN
jgi:hypothetical protein